MNQPPAPRCPTELGQIFFRGFLEILGQAGVNAAFHLSGRSHLIKGDFLDTQLAENYTCEDIGALRQAINQLYGPRGGRGMALRSGRAAFRYLARDFGEAIGIHSLEFRLIPLRKRLFTGQRLLSDFLSRQFHQQIELEETGDAWTWKIYGCMECWGVSSEEPECTFFVGMLQEYFAWVSGGKFYQVIETACSAAGSQACIFRIERKPVE